MTIRFGLLGPVEARLNGPLLRVGHLRQQCVLAALLVDANAVVSVDQLVDRVWGGRPPARATATLYTSGHHEEARHHWRTALAVLARHGNDHTWDPEVTASALRARLDGRTDQRRSRS